LGCPGCFPPFPSAFPPGAMCTLGGERVSISWSGLALFFPLYISDGFVFLGPQLLGFFLPCKLVVRRTFSGPFFFGGFASPVWAFFFYRTLMVCSRRRFRALLLLLAVLFGSRWHCTPHPSPSIGLSLDLPTRFRNFGLRDGQVPCSRLSFFRGPYLACLFRYFAFLCPRFFRGLSF